MLTRKLAAFLVVFFLSAVNPAAAIDFEWDGGAGDNLWGSFLGPESNWSPNSTPNPPDRIVLTGGSLAGPVTIDLDGPRFIQGISADGVEGTYTFINGGAGALTLLASADAAVFTRNGSGLTIDNDLLLNAADTLQVNVQPNGGKITVGGNIASSALAGTTTLMPTVSNPSLPVGVEIGGEISDGTAQTAVSAGFDNNILHTGTVRITGANTYTGATRVNIGTLEFDSIANIGGGVNALGQPASGDSTIGIGTAASGQSSAALRYIGSGGASNRVISLEGKSGDTARIESSGTGALVLSGGIVNAANNETLVLGGSNGDNNAISGTITSGGSGVTVNLRKEGNGKWILSGESPTLDGFLTIDAGELVVTSSLGSTTDNTGRLQIESGATLSLDGGFMNVLDFNNFSGDGFNFRSGELRVAAGTSAGGSGTFTIGTDGAGELQLNGGSGVFDDVTLQGADDTVSISGGGTWTFDNLDNSAGGSITATGANIEIDGDGVFTHRVNSGTSQIESRIEGTGGFTKQGNGTLEFTFGGQHSYTGPTRIEGGTLRMVGSNGVSTASPVFVGAGATLDLVGATGGEAFGPLTGAGTITTADTMGVEIFTGGENVTFSGSITGGGRLAKSSSGRQTLTGANTYTGATEINNDGGTLEIATGGSIIGTSNVALGDAILSVTGGTIDTPGNIRPGANSAVFNITAGLVKANAIDRTVTTLYLHDFNWTGGTVHLLSATQIAGGQTEINKPFEDSLTVDSDMKLIVDETLTVGLNGTLDISGGEVQADTILTDVNGVVNFNSGTMRLRDNQTLNAARLDQLDLAAPLGSNKSLIIDGTATIQAPIVLTGGTFSAGVVVNSENLILSSGTLNVTASDLDVADGEVLDVTSGMIVNVTSGALNVADGGEFNAINATLSFDDGVSNEGDINLINSTVDGGLVNGTGGSANLLGSNTFNGDLTLSGSSNLFIDIGGSGAGEFDSVGVFGNSTATLDGSLNVSLVDGFNPTAGEQFTVLTAAAITDNGLTLGGLSAGRFSLLVSGSSVILEALAGLAGDYNNDGTVDAADYTVWRDGLGSTFTIADYQVWRNNYGATAGGGSRSVPEPSTVLLMVVACAAWGRFRR